MFWGSGAQCPHPWHGTELLSVPWCWRFLFLGAWLHIQLHPGAGSSEDMGEGPSWHERQSLMGSGAGSWRKQEVTAPVWASPGPLCPQQGRDEMLRVLPFADPSQIPVRTHSAPHTPAASPLPGDTEPSPGHKPAPVSFLSSPKPSHSQAQPAALSAQLPGITYCSAGEVREEYTLPAWLPICLMP